MNSPAASGCAAPPDRRARGRALQVTEESSAFRRTVGLTAWSVLEELALAARLRTDGNLIAAVSIRELAAQVGVAKDTAARAVNRLTAAGVVCFQSRRQHGGRFGPGAYVLDLGPTGLCRADAPARAPRPSRQDAAGAASQNRDERASLNRARVNRRRDHASTDPSQQQLDLFAVDTHTAATASADPAAPPDNGPAHSPRRASTAKTMDAFAPDVRTRVNAPVNGDVQKC